MANIKFSQFPEKTTLGTVDFLVGYTGSENVQISPTNLLSTFATGSGTTGYIPKWTSGSNLGDSILEINSALPNDIIMPQYIRHAGDTNSYFGFYSNDTFILTTSNNEVLRVNSVGNVGIGTNAPVSKLDVVGGVTAQGTLVATGISQLGSSGANVYLTSSSAGNVGIGTSSPANKLDVKGVIGIQRTVNTDTSNINMEGNFNFVAASGYSHRFEQAGTEVARISPNGDVGIGTNTPGFKLEVSGGGTKSPFFTSDGGRGFKQDSVAFVGTYSNGSDANGANDLGSVNNKWRDVYLLGGVNSTGTSTFAGDVRVEDNLYLTDANTVRAKIQLNSSDRDNVDIKAVSLGSLMRFYTVDTLALTLDDSQNATFAGSIIVPEYIKHEGDLDTSIRFTTNQIRLYTANNVGLTLDSSQNATFAGNIQVSGWIKGASDTNTLYSATSLGTYLQAPTNSGTGSNIYFRNFNGTVFQTFSQVDGSATFTGVVKADGGNVALGNISGVARLQHEGSGQLKMLSSGDSHIATFTSTEATFAGDVIMSKNAGPTLNMNTNSAGNTSKILLHEGTTGSPANGASIRYDGSANNFRIGVGTDVDTTRLTIDRGTGLATFANDVKVTGEITASTANATLNLLSETNGNSTINFADPADNNVGQIIYRHNGNSMSFDTNDVERMRITSSGVVGIGTDGPFSFGTGSESGVFIQPTSYMGISVPTSTSTALILRRLEDGSVVRFYNSNSTAGNINVSGSSTVYATSSDYRLKEDLQDFTGLDMVSKIPIYDFKWKVDESRSYGVMAHELQEVLPQAVTGEKDAEEMQGVDYSKIVPLLVKSIQELKAEIEELKSK